MSEHCPTCGSPVVVVTGGGGTSHYEPESFPIRSVMNERDRYRDTCVEQQKRIEELERLVRQGVTDPA